MTRELIKDGLIYLRDINKYPPRFKIGDVVYHYGERKIVCGVVVNGVNGIFDCYPQKTIDKHIKCDTYYLIRDLGHDYYSDIAVPDEELKTYEEYIEKSD